MERPTDLLFGAVDDAASNYLQVETADLELATPCEDWNLRALLNHVFSRFVISTNAARSIPTPDFEQVEIDYVGTDPASTFKELSAEMLDAWQACTDFATERLTPLGPVPPEGVLLFGAQDVFIHAWDVAKTRGVEPQLSEAMVEVFTTTHKKSVDKQTREMFFAPEIKIADDAPPLSKLVAFLGREPNIGLQNGGR